MKVIEPPQETNRISTRVFITAKWAHICKGATHVKQKQPFGLPVVSVIKNQLLRAISSHETVYFGQKYVSFFFNFFVDFSQDNLCASIQSKNFMRNGRTCSPDALTCFACERGRSSCYERNTCECTCKWISLRAFKTCHRPQRLRCHFKYYREEY